MAYQSTPEISITVLGSGGVGKSCLIVRFVTNNYEEVYDPTIEDSYRKQYVVDDKVVLLDILDTAGQEEYLALQDQWIRDADVIVLVYSITSRGSFDEAQIHYEKIQRTTDRDEFPILLVGHKCDAANDGRREVEQMESKNLIKSWNKNVKFLEASAKKKINVNEVFETATRLYWSSRNNKSVKMAKSMKPLFPTPKCTFKCTGCCACCSFSCISIKDWCNALKYESIIEFQQNERDKITFFKVNKPPLPDIIPAPIYSLKTFHIKRKFHYQRFLFAIICGAFLPIVIIFQTCVFLMYSEKRETKISRARSKKGSKKEKDKSLFYPSAYPYEDIHASIFYDFLGIVIGRKPGQDPETVKDKKWFLRQTGLQKLKRIIASFVIALISLICFYNITQIKNDKLGVSLMETIGPFLLFWCVWLLLSLWIAYEIKITPSLPSSLRLHSVILYFGERYSHVTDAYKFLRAYNASRDKKWVLPWKSCIIIFLLGFFYALIPGITRVTIGDSSDGVEKKEFISSRGAFVSIGAIIVNFALVVSFIYAIEVQYRKHFDNYKEWMRDITMLLHKNNSNENTDNDQHYKVKKGTNFSKNIFLSLTRRANALGWLEIRSFLAVEGKILFAEQELPTLWILVLTVSLSIFILYRVYMIDGNPLQSILFNGTIKLGVICVVSLIRIAINGWKFEGLQKMQQRLLGEQKFFMRCHKSNNRGIKNIENAKLKELMIQTHYDRYTSLSIPIHNDKICKKLGSKLTKTIKLSATAEGNKIEEEEENANDEKSPLISLTSIVINGKENKQVQDSKYDDDCYSDDENEDAPLLGGHKTSGNVSNSLMDKINQMDWYSHNVAFIDEVLGIVKAKDIYPRLFGLKLNSVLAKAIGGAFLAAISTIFRLFVK